LKLKTKFKARQKKLKSNSQPLWKGPYIEGITNSLLSRFIVCRERFRILTIEGLQPEPRFNHSIEYGQMWHTCNELSQEDWESGLKQYATDLCNKYPLQQEQISHWYNICKLQFGIYLEHRKDFSKTIKGKQLYSEEVFSVAHKLPSGRIVLLRGKWDGVIKKTDGLYLEEHKTKGQVDEQQLRRQLTFDMQTMIYLVTLSEQEKVAVKGVDYNVVRRPLSGGKGSIRQHKPTKKNPSGESLESFYNRLGVIIKEDPEYFFMSFQVAVSQEEVRTFKKQFLNPILEQLCDWWDWIGTNGKPESCCEHWRTPYGIYNVLAEGGHTELDEYLDTGSKVGLQRAETLFPELEE
jgi:hypothetical protein